VKQSYLVKLAAGGHLTDLESDEEINMHKTISMCFRPTPMNKQKHTKSTLFSQSSAKYRII